MNILYENLLRFDWQNVVMILIGCLLIFLAIKKEMEPSLLLPMGFGTILVNIPLSDALTGLPAAVIIIPHTISHLKNVFFFTKKLLLKLYYSLSGVF